MSTPRWMPGVIEGLAMSEQIGPENEACEGWLILKGSVPERWKERAVPLFLVPLLPEETEKMVTGTAVLSGVSPEEERLLRMVARGLKTAAIARQLGVPLRTVERRLEKLRRRFQVPSTADLTILLSRLGFGHLDAVPPHRDEQGDPGERGDR